MTKNFKLIREPTNLFKAVAIKKVKALEGEIIELREVKTEKEDLERLEAKLEEFSEKVKQLPGIPRKGRRDNFMRFEKHFYELLKV